MKFSFIPPIYITDNLLFRKSFYLIFINLIFSSTAICQVELESYGIRSGLYASRGYVDFHQTELYINWSLPLDYVINDEFVIKNKLEFTIGRLAGKGEEAFITSFGGKFVLEKKDFPVSFAFASVPTFISKYKFSGRNLGTKFQFITSFGLVFRITKSFEASYRFQHMSNASLSRYNPGLNLSMFSLGYRF
jgi:hypothetical protein